MDARLIAVVEDDPTIRELLDTLLTGAGYRTVLHSQGKDAHLVIRRSKPDLVILDMWMENQNAGQTVLGLMQLDPATRDIPVIICSAHLKAFRSEAPEFRDKPYLFLAKPFDAGDLLTKIEGLLGRV